MDEYLFDKILLGLGIIVAVRLLFIYYSKVFTNINEKYKYDQKKRKINTYVGWFIFTGLIIIIIASILIIILL